MYARQQPHPPPPEHSPPPPPPPPLPPDEPYLPPAPPPGSHPAPQPLFDDLPPRPMFADIWNPNHMTSFHDNQAPPPYGNYDSRYNPPDVTMPTYQQRPHPGHTTYCHPDPLFPPRDVPFHSYPVEPQLTQPGYYDNRHYQANNPHYSQGNFPYWRDRSPEKVPPRQELWSQIHPYIHDREPHPFHGPLLETRDLPPSRMLGGAQRPGDIGMTVTKIVPAETIFDMPGRTERPSHIVIILRGLPGSGKSHLAKLMKEKEVHYSSSAPRILSIDDYFINEVEKKEKDPDTGRIVKKKVEEYEYDVALEPSYLASMLKQFNKTLTEGYFSMIIVDAVNSKISEFDQFWSNSKMKGFESFVVELKESIDVCVKRNIHDRTKEEIELLASYWESTPPHFLQLDVTSLLSPNETTINEVDMEMVDSDQEDENKDSKFKLQPALVKSRWEQDINEDKLDKLDGFKIRKRHHSDNDDNVQELSLKEYLQKIEMEYKDVGKPMKKRVRWADLEAAKEEMRKKEIGFSLGTGWSRVTEEEVERILHQNIDSDNHGDSNHSNKIIEQDKQL